MPRQSVVRVTAEILIPYDRQKFGATTEAEKAATSIQEAVSEIVRDTPGASTVKFEAKHTSVEKAEKSDRAA